MDYLVIIKAEGSGVVVKKVKKLLIIILHGLVEEEYRLHCMMIYLLV